MTCLGAFPRSPLYFSLCLTPSLSHSLSLTQTHTHTRTHTHIAPSTAAWPNSWHGKPTVLENWGFVCWITFFLCYWHNDCFLEQHSVYVCVLRKGRKCWSLRRRSQFHLCWCHYQKVMSWRRVSVKIACSTLYPLYCNISSFNWRG